MRETTTTQTVRSLIAISFFFAFNYFILKSLKETLLITSPEAGAEVIPFVKMWVLFPTSLALLAAFTWLASKFSYRLAVFALIFFFLACYAIFAFALYPYRENLHLHEVAKKMKSVLPMGWHGLSSVVRYWSFSLFYVTTECWCTIAYSVIFWGYANAALQLSEAKKYYPYLTLAGTAAALIAAPVTLFLTGDFFNPTSLSRWDFSFYSLVSAVLISGTIALTLFLTNCPPIRHGFANQKRLPFLTAFLNVFRSKYLMTLAVICVMYNLLINLTDVIWKNEVLKVHSDPADFTRYLGGVTLMTGIVSTFLTLFICRQSLKNLGWTATALLTPTTALITGTLFFFVLFGGEYGGFRFSLSTIVFLGSFHICLSSAAKYTLFEPTKEMAFIPLSAEEKLHGKAAIDGLGSRLGKTGSSIIYQFLLVLLPSISSCAPFVAIMMIAALFLCITCVVSLGKQIELQHFQSS